MTGRIATSRVWRTLRPPIVALALALVAGAAAGLALTPDASDQAAVPAAPAGPATCTGSVAYVVAHQDDSLLFQSPDILHDVRAASRCVATVVLTAGENGRDQNYWSSRDAGLLAAYANMAGRTNAWTSQTVQIAGHAVNRRTLIADDRIVVYFLRLPDGGHPNGDGTARYGFQSLKKLWTGDQPTVSTVDGSATYSRDGLISTIRTLLEITRPSRIATQDYAGQFGDDDHPDHYAAAYFVREAHKQYAPTHTFVGYLGYQTLSMPANVSGSDPRAKRDAFYTYARYDDTVCQSERACSTGGYGAWLDRQYTVPVPDENRAPVAWRGGSDVR